MIAASTGTLDRRADRSRIIAWIGFLSLLLSLLAPQLSIESAEAAQTFTTQQECDEGFVRNERTGECVPEPQRVPGQVTTECPEGTERERETGACIPVTETTVPETETPIVTEEVTEVPATETATSVATEPAPPPGYAQAIKRACPDGFIPDETTTITDLQSTCLDPVEGVLFHILTGDVTHASVPTDATGLSQLGSAPVGEIVLVEEIPAGYGEPIVYCAEGYAFGPFEHTYTEEDRQPVLNGNAIAWTLTSDTLLQCYVYNIVEPAPDGPGDLATEGTAQAIEAADGNSVTLRKFRCPLGMPEDSEDLTTWAQLCTAEFDGIDFTLDHAGGSAPGTTENGEIVWTDVAAGNIDIHESIPAGYKEPVVFCFSAPAGIATEPEQMAVSEGGFSLTIPQDGWQVICEVFNLQDENANSLMVHKWECPAGFDETVNDPEVHCTTPLDGVTFTLGDMEATTGDAGPGNASFTGVPNGDHDLTEVLPDGYERAFVGPCLRNGQATLLVVGEGESAPLLELGFGEDETSHWECDWYNVPIEPEENRITLRKWICPPGTGQEESQGWYESNCIQQHNGVTFQVTHDGGSASDATVGGVVVFDPVPAGTVTIEETIPAGFGEPVVFCAVDNQWTQHDASNPIGAWQHEFPDDGVSEQLHCYLYNIISENRTVIAHKLTCPAGLEPESEDFADWQDTCDEPASGVEFTLTDANGESTKATSAAGWVPFYNVAQGEVSLTEHTPPGYQPAIVYCSLLAFDASGGVHNENTGIVQTDGTISRELDYPGFLWTCWFFNIPIDPEENEVEIHKWQCPEGTEPDQPVDWYEANCLLQHNGVEFTVASDIGIAVQETAGGTASFPGLPAGTVSIQEDIPDGYGPPMVFCGIEGAPQPYPAPTGHWQHDFPNDGLSETLVCWVFNIPGEPPDITVTKWTCPPGYDLYAAGADPKTDCTEATDGVTFELRYAGHDEVEESQTSGDVIAGGVFFDDLQPDTYEITELVPAGIGSVFVLECTGHIMGVLQPSPLSTDNVLEDIDLDTGEHLVCDWYNVPDDGGRLKVIKHICATETFVSEVDCEIFEDGATFDLLWWDGAAWQAIDTGTTDGFGLITWTDLDSGEYWLDEHDGEWCHIVAAPEGDEDSFPVADGEDTVVNVYNCDPDWTTTTIPEKYPNTGAPPASDDASSPGA